MKRYNNKALIAVLVVLAAAFTLSRVFRAPGLESNMRKKLVALDTTAITEIRIVQPQQPVEIKLVYRDKDSTWTVVEAERLAAADGKEVSDLLRVAGDIQLESMVSRKKEKWDAFDVGDSSATKVSFYAGKKKQADLRIGKIGFLQNAQKSMYTYVRAADDDAVYTTKAFLRVYFNKGFDEWRNKALLRLAKEDITKVTFNYPDSGFVLAKRDSLWYVGSRAVIPSRVTTYLNRLQRRDMTGFNDDFVPPIDSTPLVVQMADDENVLAFLKAWRTDSTTWTVSSSLQEGIYFVDKDGQIVKDLFVGQNAFFD